MIRLIRLRTVECMLLSILAMSIVNPGAAGATTITFASATAMSECSIGCSIDQDEGLISAGASVSGSGISSTGRSTAGIGYVRAFASVSVNDDPDDRLGRGSATAQGNFSDQFTIDGGSLNGSTGSMNFSISVSGGGLSAQSSSDLTIRPFPAADALIRTRVDVRSSVDDLFLDNTVSVFDGPGTGTITGTVAFVYGQPIDLSVEGLATAQVQGDGRASANFSNTIEWGGISEIRDEFGNVVTLFEVESDSGVDWSQPVFAPIPEPSTLPLVMLGLLGLRQGRRLARPRRD